MFEVRKAAVFAAIRRRQRGVDQFPAVALVMPRAQVNDKMPPWTFAVLAGDDRRVQYAKAGDVQIELLPAKRLVDCMLPSSYNTFAYGLSFHHLYGPLYAGEAMADAILDATKGRFHMETVSNFLRYSAIASLSEGGERDEGMILISRGGARVAAAALTLASFVEKHRRFPSRAEMLRPSTQHEPLQWGSAMPAIFHTLHQSWRPDVLGPGPEPQGPPLRVPEADLEPLRLRFQTRETFYETQVRRNPSHHPLLHDPVGFDRDVRAAAAQQRVELVIPRKVKPTEAKPAPRHQPDFRL